MAAEWAVHGIQANAIGPGYMVTEMNKALVENPELRRLGQGTHAGHSAGASRRNWSGAAVFLASAASDYVNGQIIYVDGGMLAVL